MVIITQGLKNKLSVFVSCALFKLETSQLFSDGPPTAWGEGASPTAIRVVGGQMESPSSLTPSR